MRTPEAEPRQHNPFAIIGNMVHHGIEKHQARKKRLDDEKGVRYLQRLDFAINSDACAGEINFLVGKETTVLTRGLSLLPIGRDPHPSHQVRFKPLYPDATDNQREVRQRNMKLVIKKRPSLKKF